ncbi:MAG: very short patch repair endonuclease [Acidobacteriota bacterium]|nr:very short patch repair endonuclease [Acidobacteriota bacterium]
MSQVRGWDTAPELTVRHLLHRMGFRYRLHVRSLPGTPDLVFPAKRKIVFIHGCFWHGHDCRAGANRPSSNVGYWTEKLSRTSDRDRRVDFQLKQLGWDVLSVWECQIREDRSRIVEGIARFLGRGQRQ